MDGRELEFPMGLSSQVLMTTSMRSDTTEFTKDFLDESAAVLVGTNVLDGDSREIVGTITATRVVRSGEHWELVADIDFDWDSDVDFEKSTTEG